MDCCWCVFVGVEYDGYVIGWCVVVVEGCFYCVVV